MRDRMAALATGSQVFEASRTFRRDFLLLPDPDGTGSFPGGDYPDQSPVDPGAFQRASCKRDLSARWSDSPRLSETRFRGEFLITRTIPEVAVSFQTSSIPGHLVVALLGLDTLRSREPRKQRIEQPFAQDARAIGEIGGFCMERPIEFFQVKIFAFVEGRNRTC